MPQVSRYSRANPLLRPASTANRIFGHRDELGHNVLSFFPEETEISIETMTVGFESELTHPRRRDPQDRLPVTYDRPPDNEVSTHRESSLRLTPRR